MSSVPDSLFDAMVESAYFGIPDEIRENGHDPSRRMSGSSLPTGGRRWGRWFVVVGLLTLTLGELSPVLWPAHGESNPTPRTAWSLPRPTESRRVLLADRLQAGYDDQHYRRKRHPTVKRKKTNNGCVPPISRRVFLVFVGVGLGVWLIVGYAGDARLGWLATVGVGLIPASTFYFFLSGFAFTWCWWP